RPAVSDPASLLLLALAAGALAQLPLVWWLARRGQAARVEASEATDAERLRIAATLRDGVVQELAGVAWGLAATADQLDELDAHQVEQTLRRSAGVARDSITALRSLLVELCPPEPARDGLQAAFEELAGPLRRRGVAVDVRVSGEAACDEED